jgi:imidazolonepropionase-like amidohydrolase
MRHVALATALALATASACRVEPSANAPAAPSGPGDAARDAPSTIESDVVLAGGTVVGQGRLDVEIKDGRIVAVGKAAETATRIDVTGRFLTPAFIDSHVHLAYLPKARELAAGGIAAAVDLAAPITTLGTRPEPIELLASGPMLTAPLGYPTQSWGRDGYGREVSSPAEAIAAVDELYRSGARVLKLALAGSPALDPATLRAATTRAHELGMKVAAHAVSDAEALRAADSGADVLAHTPVEALSEATLSAWQNRAVISTLAAFGGEPARRNLRELQKRGAVVLYGTDFGNVQTAGINPEEIAELTAAGLDASKVIDSATSAPASYWGFGDLGAIAVGRSASILVLESDPMTDPSSLARPIQVYVRGRKL